MFGKSPRRKAMKSIMLCSQEVISLIFGDHMMSCWTHFMGITSSIRAQYSIYLPVHYRFFGRLKTVPLDRDNGTFNNSNTDVVKKVNFLVAA